MHVTRCLRDCLRNYSIYLCVYIHAHVCCVCDRGHKLRGQKTTPSHHKCAGNRYVLSNLLYVRSEFHSQHGKNKTQPYGQAPRQIDLHRSQHLPKRTLSLKKGPLAIGCWGVQRRMRINSHPQILLRQEQVQSLRHSQTPHRDGTVNHIHLLCISRLYRRYSGWECVPRSTEAKPHTRKGSQWVCGRFFIKTIRCSPRNGLSSRSSQSVQRQESRKRVVSLHWPPQCKQNALSRCFQKNWIWRELKPFLIQYLSAEYLQ